MTTTVTVLFSHIKANILLLFILIEKNNIIVLVYTHRVISTTLNLNICRRKSFRSNLIDTSKDKFSPAILFCLDHASLTPQGVNNAQLLPLQGSEPIRLLQTGKSLSMYILKHANNNNNNNLPLFQMFIIDRTLGTSPPADNEKI